MMTAMGWVLFGMAVWGLCILMEALQRRYAPEAGDQGSERHHRRSEPPPAPDPRDREIAELKRRVEALEAIVTDRRYQWEDALARDGR